ILDNLIGAMYSRKTVAIRELIQNAIDACILQQVLEDDYDPKIEIILDNETLVVRDNGRGMSLDIIKNYLKVLGKSYYKSNDLAGVLKNFITSPDFIAEFGLGIFSYFLLAKSFTIYTRHREIKSDMSSNQWHKIEFTRGFCLIEKTPKPDIGFDYGTVVQIKLNQDIIDILTYYFKYQIHLDIVRPRIPISCRISDSSKPI
ncbi:unnamed protein product, partial [marine sediment metagenome]